MILNLLIAFFLAFMIYWWATQGLFSALLHLVLTVAAAVLALAVWEPIVHGLLIGYIPEYAWGIGLLAPFGVILLLLRTLFDRAIGANVHFPDMVNKIGGGAVGFAAGIVTAGMLVIGLQMAGPPDLFGYQAYELDERGQVVRKGGLWVPVDSITADLLNRLGGGSLSPIASTTPLPYAHPDLAVEAAFFVQGASGHSRRALHPDHVRVLDEDYFILHQAPGPLQGALELGPNERVVILGTRITLQPQEGRSGADEDGRFRISRKQVALACEENDRVVVRHPVGYVQGGQYQPFLHEGWEDAYSQAAVQEEQYHWVFRIAEAQEPLYLRLKQTRFALPPTPLEDAGDAGRVVTAGPRSEAEMAAANGEEEPAADTDGQEISPGRGGHGGAAGDFIQVSDRLPFTMNSNQLSGVRLAENNAVISTRDAGVSARRQRTTIGGSLAVNTIYHDTQTSSVVQVNIGANTPQSILGRVFEAAQQTQAPILEDDAGRRYFAMGYGVQVGREQFRFRIDRNNTIRALSQIDLGRVSAEDEVILYYEVPKGITLTRFTIGRQVQDVNLRVE